MIIETRGLVKEFDATVAVAGVDLKVPEGEIYALIGPNGAGKTTLMRMICGLLEPTGGSVLVNGIDVWEHNLDANAYMAFLPDFFGLYTRLTVEEYLDYFAHAYKLPPDSIPVRVNEVLATVNLNEKRRELVGSLSRGMQQRLGIAKSIIHSPRLLVLDEPAAGLDPIARSELSAMLRKLQSRGVTILISSHILSELQDFCTAVGIMERGRLVESGAIKSILAKQGIDQQVVVELAGDTAPVLAFLAKQRTALGAKAAPGGLSFTFKGTDAQLVELHRAIMAQGFAILGFARKQQGIQDIFTKVTREAERAGARR